MCCFSRAVPFVGATKIFARGLADGTQALVYAMDVELSEELAMVLPLPCPPRPAEDAVRFVDLSGYPAFFGDMAKAFPAIVAQSFTRSKSHRATLEKTLVVHDVGDFVASFVPARDDFTRLDPRFRLPDVVWGALPAYADWSFAVFALKPRAKGKRQSVHPMAFTFPRREPRSLFFPTVHVHDGGHVPEDAKFDHALYCQADGVLDALLDWEHSTGALGAFVDTARTHGLVDGAAKGRTKPLVGPMANTDTWLREPPGIALSDVRGEGDSFSWELGARSHYMHQTTFSWGTWHRTSEADLVKLARSLGPALADLTRSKRSEWKLGARSPQHAPHFMNGPKLWKGDDWMTQGGPAPNGGGKGYVRFKPYTRRVEPQGITLFFDEMPNEERALEIEGTLKRMLDFLVSDL
jgi:hypothetical protein